MGKMISGSHVRGDVQKIAWKGRSNKDYACTRSTKRREAVPSNDSPDLPTVGEQSVQKWDPAFTVGQSSRAPIHATLSILHATLRAYGTNGGKKFAGPRRQHLGQQCSTAAGGWGASGAPVDVRGDPGAKAAGCTLTVVGVLEALLTWLTQGSRHSFRLDYFNRLERRQEAQMVERMQSHWVGAAVTFLVRRTRTELNRHTWAFNAGG
uniref:Uncharacterized protein n=1 Tax=Trichuris muris TaxID=70415 RepID=A0A5S6Q7V8_TRIMR